MNKSIIDELINKYILYETIFLEVVVNRGPTEQYILDEKSKHRTLCFPLLDAENHSTILSTSKTLEMLGASAILVGGSSVYDQIELFQLVNKLKKGLKIPIILFPGNVTGIVSNADAVLFTSLLNSENSYYITGAQAQGALIVNKYNLEAIPTGYIIVGDNTTAWFVGQARSIPFNKYEIALMYALAAQYMGMRFLYLEAGSGASNHIKPQMISLVRKFYKGIILVGGGINSPETAKEISDSGADIIVVGTMLEKNERWEDVFLQIINSIHK